MTIDEKLFDEIRLNSGVDAEKMFKDIEYIKVGIHSDCHVYKHQDREHYFLYDPKRKVVIIKYGKRKV